MTSRKRHVATYAKRRLQVTPTLILSAIRHAPASPLSFWTSLIVPPLATGGCGVRSAKTCSTEQTYDGVKVENPSFGEIPPAVARLL